MKWIKQKIFPILKNKKTALLPISKAPLPPYLIFPLIDSKGNLLTSSVKVGEHVLKGQPLTSSKSFEQAVVHASSSGVVREIKEHPITHSFLSAAPCIIIDTDGKETLFVPENSSAKSLPEKCHQAGIIGLGGAGFPTAQKATNQKIEILIINGMECEPPISADEGLMQESAEKICAGALLVQEMVCAREIIIAIEKDKKEAIAAMSTAATQYPALRIEIMPGGYPSGSEKQLIHALTGKEIAKEAVTTQAGFLMVNVATAAAVYDAVVENKPLLSRIMTLAGSVFSGPQNLEVLNGTPVKWLLQHYGLCDVSNKRVVQGGSLMGMEVKDLEVPITKVTNCLWVEPSKILVEEQPCIRCGFCTTVCPANLLPQQLYWFIQGNNLEEAQAHHLNACIECGACAYVCPSHIPLVQYYQEAKHELKRIESEQQQALAAKERYEARQQRLARRAQMPGSPLAEEVLDAQVEIGSFSLDGNIDKKAAILAAVARRKKSKPVSD